MCIGTDCTAALEKAKMVAEKAVDEDQHARAFDIDRLKIMIVRASTDNEHNQLAL